MFLSKAQEITIILHDIVEKVHSCTVVQPWQKKNVLHFLSPGQNSKLILCQPSTVSNFLFIFYIYEAAMQKKIKPVVQENQKSNI